MKQKKQHSKKERTPKRKKSGSRSPKQRSNKKTKHQHTKLPDQQLHYQRCQYVPFTQEHLKAILLEYLGSPYFGCFTHELEIFELIKHWYSGLKNAEIYMKDLNLTLILKQLSKMNVLTAKQQALGTKVVLVIQQINLQKIKQLRKEVQKDLPSKVPPDLSIFFQMKSKSNSSQCERIAKMLNGSQMLFMNGDSKINATLKNMKSFTEASEAQLSKKTKRFDLCEFRTKEICYAMHGNINYECMSRHLIRMVSPTTDESFGVCPYLENCLNKECRFVHYADQEAFKRKVLEDECELLEKRKCELSKMEWINCDLLNFNYWILGKFNVIMADPPWEINMVLPYGTVRDKDLMNMRVDLLQDQGLIFLWVTGRAMELGRECLKKWGYQRVEEIVWIKINQIHEMLKRGITGHWLNHSKQHCLVGMKGNPKINRNVDCDVLVSKLRETSQKPDQIYQLIQRMSPGGKKIQLFGRPYNCKVGWLTLGNQLPGAHILDQQILQRYRRVYPQQNLSLYQMQKNLQKMQNSQQFDKIYKSHIQVNHQQPAVTTNNSIK